MKTRVLSGLIMAPFLGVLVLGDYVVLAAAFIIGIAACYEFFKGFKQINIFPSFTVAIIVAIVLYSVNLFKLPPVGYAGACMIALLGSVLYLFNIDNRKLEDGIFTFFGILYIIGCSFHVALVEQQNELLVWLVVLSAFGTDVFAYFSGYLFGKHKLCPKISPKKTIEGSIGGVLGSIILCGVFGYFLLPNLLIHCIIIGALGSVVAQIGDLTASIFKRKMDIKDYGNLIPGHGGILDRFDSVLFTAPLVFYYVAIVIG